jgi:hypothetical protein
MRRVNSARQESVLMNSTGRALHGQYGEMQELKRLQDLMKAQVFRLEELRDTQLRIYYAARQARELLSEMRVTKCQEYSVDLAHREQSALDDNFIARRRLA